MKRITIFSAINICFILFGCSCTSTRTLPITSGNEKNIPGSIASLEQIKIGGVNQWILIRGKNINNPILFKLHGGPGQAEMATVNYNKELEEHFNVVEWDQRGAGKSYEAINPRSGMTLNQLVEDTKEISEYLLKKFHQQKLILVGHSWGSIMGMVAVQKYPSLFKAFVSTGQIVNMTEGVKIAYKHLRDSAKTANNHQAFLELERIGDPPYYDKDQDEKRAVFNKWMENFKADWHGVEPLPRVKLMMASVEYSLSEKLRFQSAAKESFHILFPDLMKFDLISQVKTVQVPVYFAIGRFDYRTPPELLLNYFDILQAPKKKWKWFENSSHFPQLEEPKEFCEFLVNTVLADVR